MCATSAIHLLNLRLLSHRQKCKFLILSIEKKTCRFLMIHKQVY